MRRVWSGVGMSVALVVGSNSLAAQDWQDLSVSRALDGERRVETLVRYGAGVMRLSPAAGGTLYRMDLTWDDDKFEPVNVYRDGRLELGVDQRGRSLNIRGRNRGEMDVELGADVPMDLALEFGAVEAEVELGGLSLSSLEISTGASESTVRVSRPNQIDMGRATLDVGAADFEARGLANLRARELEVNAGVGSVVLDLGGELVDDLDVKVMMGVGSLELRIPEGAGVRIEKESFLTSFDTNGMVKRGGAWYSSGWDDADHRIQIDVETAFGSVEVVWTR